MDYLDKILDTPEKIKGELYLITNTVTNKKYVGQTLTHRRNKGKYRPFGYMGRFNDHISEAKCDSVKRAYLKSSIRKHGRDSFKVELLERCEISDLDSKEIQFIKELDTLYPNGYNLTTGGKTARCIEVDPKDMFEGEVKSNGRRKYQTDVTKQKIKQRLSEYYAQECNKIKRSEITELQHFKRKLNMFDGIVPDIDQMDTYITSKVLRGHRTFKVTISGVSTTFYSKVHSDEAVKEKAKKFIKLLIDKGDTTELREHP